MSRASSPPKRTSPWLDGTPGPNHPPLAGAARADVAVVGAGIAGLSTALLLAEAGRDVHVVEMDRVGAGATGHTTAKVSSQHGLIYATIASRHGEGRARDYAEANQAALELVARWVRERKIDCDWRRRDAYAYVLTPDARGQVEAEAETAARLGLPAELVDATPLPYPVEAAVRFRDQGEFDAYRYVAGLAKALVAAGGRISEATRATGLSEGSPHELETDRGTVRADHVVVASHMPFLDRALTFARATPERSYSVAVRLRGLFKEFF